MKLCDSDVPFTRIYIYLFVCDLGKSVLSVYHVDSGDQNQVVSGRRLYLLSYLVWPSLEFFRVTPLMC